MTLRPNRFRTSSRSWARLRACVISKRFRNSTIFRFSLDWSEAISGPTGGSEAEAVRDEGCGGKTSVLGAGVLQTGAAGTTETGGSAGTDAGTGAGPEDVASFIR